MSKLREAAQKMLDITMDQVESARIPLTAETLEAYQFLREALAEPEQRANGCASAYPGMTLRDYFAAKAMQGAVSEPSLDMTAKGFAEYAYRIADAMMEARK